MIKHNSRSEKPKFFSKNSNHVRLTAFQTQFMCKPQNFPKNRMQKLKTFLKCTFPQKGKILKLLTKF